MVRRQPKSKHYSVIYEGKIIGTIVATTKTKALMKAKKTAIFTFGDSKTIRVIQIDEKGWRKHPKNRRYN